MNLSIDRTKVYLVRRLDISTEEMAKSKMYSKGPLTFVQAALVTLLCNYPHAYDYAYAYAYANMLMSRRFLLSQDRGWKRNHWTLVIHDSCPVLPQ